MDLNYPEQWLAQASKGEGVAADLRLKIVAGLIGSGENLTENQIAERYNVSRSPVRDAFKLLQQDKLVRLERMGATVLSFNDKEKKEFYDLRIMLESFAFTRLQQVDRKAVVSEMQKQLAMMKVAVQFDDAETFTEHDIRFHEALIIASDHTYLMIFWNYLKPIMEALVLISMRKRMEQQPQDFERIHNNHQAYITAVAENDASQLKQAFHRNFDDVGQDVERFWL
ncbi:GntR family transcriptional regulator, gluconate operon transcriptional repressor [Staphylococcus auricularis]|uniref:GntR family transcriptional regulator n=1 Tax=Staphylococcus auricularis TaxID=29379 RepID=A0AAP8PQD5_9STAP|nr:GntR family transcriptional regulator [Staphylococcus auricularis]MBM0867449.1 GntR family transcriptional regulator [Staphylococcus auricularis]MDC6327717.1 GntR family transcriptional regulator [Staphylococcus auricularis]MDN4533669.1 GntR family transcriptional regulator [Staphylococcus auricularis]PNZ68813.1 GntR family transcriptional regulator [Staphylococcus auricularis]QPT06470.1 GntR family transcriptional regulator [Staphylococcus auricularis]